MMKFLIDVADSAPRAVYVMSAIGAISLLSVFFVYGIIAGIVATLLAALAWIGGLTFPLFFKDKEWKFLRLEKAER